MGLLSVLGSGPFHRLSSVWAQREKWSGLPPWARWEERAAPTVVNLGVTDGGSRPGAVSISRIGGQDRKGVDLDAESRVDESGNLHQGTGRWAGGVQMLVADPAEGT